MSYERNKKEEEIERKNLISKKKKKKPTEREIQALYHIYGPFFLQYSN